MTTSPSVTPAAAAVAYAQEGWPVFPLHSVNAQGRCTCGKDCGRNAAKHPRTINGLHSATTDQDRVRGWWDQWPNANIGVVTGSAAGLFVLDIDPESGGWESADALEAASGNFPRTRAARTGGDGLHLYFRWPHHGTIKNSTGVLGPGLDIRGDGGYIIAPPSMHRSGARYAWEDWGGGDGADELAPAPAWLLARIVKYPVPPSVAGVPFKSHQGASEGPIPEGERNSTLTSKAGLMRRHGFSEAEILAALEQMNADRCHPPLPSSEVARIAQSIGKKTPGYRLPAATVRLASGVVITPRSGGRHGR